MERGPIQPRKLVYRGLLSEPYRSRALVRGISPPFGRLSPRVGQVAHVLLTRAPLYRGRSPFSCDLHVLGAPLTFALSQDQTLLRNSAKLSSLSRRSRFVLLEPILKLFRLVCSAILPTRLRAPSRPFRDALWSLGPKLDGFPSNFHFTTRFSKIEEGVPRRDSRPFLLCSYRLCFGLSRVFRRFSFSASFRLTSGFLRRLSFDCLGSIRLASRCPETFSAAVSSRLSSGISGVAYFPQRCLSEALRSGPPALRGGGL